MENQVEMKNKQSENLREIEENFIVLRAEKEEFEEGKELEIAIQARLPVEVYKDLWKATEQKLMEKMCGKYSA